MHIEYDLLAYMNEVLQHPKKLIDISRVLAFLASRDFVIAHLGKR